MIRRHELTDARRARLPAMDRLAKDHRTIVNAILWRLKPGAPWRDLPEQYGP